MMKRIQGNYLTKIDVPSETIRLLLLSAAVTKDECFHPIFTKWHHLLESIVQLIEAELFQSQWDSQGQFLDLYAQHVHSVLGDKRIQ